MVTCLTICCRAAVLLLAALLPLSAAAQCYTWPVESVYDGDTLRATVNGTSTPIRILNIDTAEMPPRHECEYERRLAYAARDRLRELIGGASQVAICPEGVDRYRRTLARVLVDGVDVGEVLVSEGLAEPWRGRQADWCS
jgi:endonuclease YncB( thermonuclease family)